MLATARFFDVGAAFAGTLEAELDDVCAGAEAEHGTIEDGGLLICLILQLMDPCRLHSMQAIELTNHS